MNNEPVAWMSNGQEFYVQKNYCPDFIPLYTHPAKTLTDEYCKAYWGKDNCFVDVFLPNSETEVIRFWNDQLNESYEPKTLTDEEISDVINNEFGHKFNGYEICFLYAFARAILRKAQEK